MKIKAKLNITEYDRVVYSTSIPPRITSQDCVYIIASHPHGEVDILYPVTNKEYQIFTVPAPLLRVLAEDIK